jgi:hypothetical protein
MNFSNAAFAERPLSAAEISGGNSRLIWIVFLKRFERARVLSEDPSGKVAPRPEFLPPYANAGLSPDP